MSKSRFIGVGAAFLMAFALLLAYGNSAYAGSPTGSISGKITKDSGGTNVEGAVIFVTDFTTGAIIGNATSTASGTYTVGSLDAGTYRVQVNATDQGLPVLYYNGVSDADSATSVSVAEHATVINIDIDLSNGGTISGTVTDGADPISGAEVWAEVYDCCGAGNGTLTAGDGTFSISGLPAGDYRVIAAAPDQGFAHEFYNNTTVWESAARVTVTNGGDATLTDFSLSSGGTISGTVIKDSDSTAVANADVFAQSYDGTEGGGGTQTDGSGNYSIVGLPSGDYRVEVIPNSGSLSGEFYNDTTDWFQAARVAVSANATTTLSNISLSSGTSIAGKVTDSSTNPIVNADVWAELYDCCGGNGTQTDSNGDYTISGLTLGDYRVQVNVPGQSFTTEFYNNTSDWFLASRVTTNASSTVTGIDFQLDAGGSISGNVTDGVPSPVADAWVWAETYDCCGAGGGAQTDSSGNYTISGLAAGNYRVQVFSDTQNLASEFYNNTTDWSAAAQVAVTANNTTASINFQLASGGSISGTVTDGTNPIANVDVWADAYDCCGGGNGTQTDANGNYTISGLAAGDYRVQVNVFDQNFAGEYYNNKTDWLLADRVTVVSSQTTTLVDFILSGGGSISGTITDGNSNPVANADVWAETYDCCGGNGSRTDSTGNYTISGLAAGNYRVQVFVQGQNLSSEFYNNQTDWWLADTVIVTESVTTANIDFILSSGGSISGTVTDGTNPIANVDVWAESYDCCAGGNGTQTASDGTYTISGLTPGDYRVQIFINSGSFSGEFYNDTRDWFLADRVTVVADQTTAAINFALDAGGSISGTVTDSIGGPIPNADVWAETYDCCGGNGTRTDASGNYTISGLATGNYRVQVHVFGADYTGEFYNDTTDWGLAAQVAVTAGQTTTLIDFQLGAGGSISGKVTDGTNPVAGADIWANSFDCCGGNGTRSKSDGTYTINGLAPGSYRIQVYVGNQDLAGEFYNDKADWDTADAVVVTASQTTNLVDIVLASGGSISGTITDGSNPIANADVWASSYDGSGGFGWGRSFSDGTYTISGLLPGAYRVEVSAEGKIHTLYNGTSSWENATAVTVLSGQTTPNIDFTLDNGGTITGTVRDGNGAAVANAEVNAGSYDGAGGWGWTQTKADGTFVIDGLATGDYRVQAGAPQLGMTYEYYNETSDWNSAARVSVSEGVTTSSIDFTLGGGGTVSGTVTDSVGGPVANAWVWADLYDCCGGNGASTALDGTYTIPGLAPGDYRVQVFAEDKGLVGEFYNNTADWSLAARVTVAEGLTTANIDFSLGGGGSLSGIVTDSIGGPVANAWVWADLYDCCGGNGTATGSDGTYKITGLAPGNYRVQVMAQEQGLTSEFYNGTSNWDLATSVAVVSGQDTPSINFSLSAGGSISGMVYEDDGITPIPNVWVWADVYDCCGGGNGAESDATGAYTINGLATGDYRVQVWAMDLGLVGEFYNNTNDWELANRVTVTAGNTSPNIDFTLGAGGSLSGIVTDGNGAPLANVHIWAETFVCCSGGNGAMTELDGTYTVSGLAPGDYRVQVFAQELGFAVEYYNDVNDWESALPVTVTSGADTPNINFALAAGGSISGRVIADSDGLGVAGAWVWAESLTCCSGNEARTNPDGTYTVFGLVPGQYIVSVDAAEHGLSGEFYNNTLDWTAATPVTVTSGGDALGIDFSLGGGGTIKGKVTQADGVTPIANAVVFAEPDWEGAVEVEVKTKTDGTYEIIGLSPGPYILVAAGFGYALEFYNETNDFELAEIVSVHPDLTTIDVNFTLDVGGTISGTVTNGSTPIAFSEIVAWPTSKPFNNVEFTFGEETAFDGSYELVGLSPGEYYVFALGTDEGYAFEFYGDTAVLASATTVTVVAGQDTPSIDFVLSLGGTISGSVKKSDGVTPVPVMGVIAVEAVSGLLMGMTETAFDGSYTLVGIPAGSYIVFTEDILGLGYIEEYYNNVAVQGSATPVAVTVGQVTSGINFTLDIGSGSGTGP